MTSRISFTTAFKPLLDNVAALPDKIREYCATSSLDTPCQIGRITFSPSTSFEISPSSSNFGQFLEKNA